MILLLNNLKNRILTLDSIIEDAEERVGKAPQGKLIESRSHGKVQFYNYDQSKEKSRSYISLKNQNLIASLAQKDYDNALIKVANKERKLLIKLTDLYDSTIAEDIYNKLTPARKELVTPILLPDDEFVRQWLEEPYEHPGFEDDDPEFFTEKNLRVRSKSEISIANKYDAHSIPMKYEAPLFLEGYGWVNPDFRLLNVRLRKEYIHEHLGKMDDPDYATKNVAKINWYMRNGWIPGKNLILTMETLKNPFDARIMEDIIEQYLI